MRGTLLQPAMPDYQRVASQGPKNFGALVALACVGWKVKCLNDKHINIYIYISKIFTYRIHVEYIGQNMASEQPSFFSIGCLDP